LQVFPSPHFLEALGFIPIDLHFHSAFKTAVNSVKMPNSQALKSKKSESQLGRAKPGSRSSKTASYDLNQSRGAKLGPRKEKARG
jgi:hypothetical protein